MAVIDTGLVEAGLKNEFFARLAEVKAYYDRLATRVESKKDSEKYGFLGTVPQMRSWGTGRLAKGIRSESYTVENEKYEATIEVDRDELSDDQTGQIRLRIAELSARAGTHKDYLISELMKNGHQAGFNAYDGKPFFSEDHESGESGEQSNTLEHEVATPTAVTVTQFKDALKNSIATMMAFKDDQGQPMMVGMDGLVIVTPPQLYFTAKEAVAAAVIDATGNVVRGVADVIGFPWLTDGTEWYLGNTSAHIRPFVFQDREPIEFGSLEQKSESGFLKEKYIYGVRARYAVTYGYWQYCVKTKFKTPD